LNIEEYLAGFSLSGSAGIKTQVLDLPVRGSTYPVFINEYWTSKQRQASSIHEISYRACFKPQLPHFFIERLTAEGETVYDPFLGRGTTIIEAALMGRNVAGNDVNPLSLMLTRPRLFIPNLADVQQRLSSIPVNSSLRASSDLSMFFHPQTEAEIVSLRNYLDTRKQQEKEDEVDQWIRMVATNRLTGHSANFFSGYTLPPNQAISAEKQRMLNIKHGKTPGYKNVKSIILKKSRDLLRSISEADTSRLRKAGEKAILLNTDARHANSLPDSSVSLTITSPPFLNVVQYAADNWLRCWFNNINLQDVSTRITMSKTIEEWEKVMRDVFVMLHSKTKHQGYVAFEVGEVRNGKVKLENHVVPLGLEAGFDCLGIIINQQQFTKTSNIWGVSNNTRGTNTNRIVLFKKSK